MKLIFSKNSSNEIDVKLQNGTIVEDFTYTEMIRQMLVDQDFRDTDFGCLSVEEQSQLNIILSKIADIFKEGESI